MATIRECLNKRFSPPEHAILWEVRNGVGFRRSPRTADAIAMSLWPSRGLELIGIEVKIARSDWLRELKNPAKAEEIARYCDRWWLVAGPDVATLEEIPKNWGWLVQKGSRLVAEKQAPELKKPKRIDRLFLASLFKELSNAQSHFIPKSEIAAELQRKYDKGFEAGKVPSYEEKRTRLAFETLRDRIDAFEKASGVQIDRWHGPRIGAAVRQVLLGDVKTNLEGLADQADAIASNIRETLKEDEPEETPKLRPGSNGAAAEKEVTP